MTSLGNVVVNRIFEGSYFLQGQPAGTKMPKLRPTSTREMRDLWIRAKWLERRFVAPLSREEIADLLSLWNERQHFHNQRLQQQQEPKDAETETVCSSLMTRLRFTEPLVLFVVYDVLLFFRSSWSFDFQHVFHYDSYWWKKAYFKACSPRFFWTQNLELKDDISCYL